MRSTVPRIVVCFPFERCCAEELPRADSLPLIPPELCFQLLWVPYPRLNPQSYPSSYVPALPTPYSRLNAVRGTKGAFEDFPARLYLEGSPGGHAWKPIDDALRAQYTHPLWQRIGDIARAKGGHGGMDYIMAFRMVETMRQGLVPDFDVYDAAAWSAPWPLSEASLALSSAPVRFPDFTRGGWQRTGDAK